MPFDWACSSAILFESNGTALFRSLQAASARLTAALAKLEAQAASLNATLANLDKTAAATASAVGDLGAVFTATGAAAGASAAGATAAAAGYTRAAAAAAAATANIARMSALSTAAGGMLALPAIPRVPALGPGMGELTSAKRLMLGAGTNMVPALAGAGGGMIPPIRNVTPGGALMPEEASAGYAFGAGGGGRIPPGNRPFPGVGPGPRGPGFSLPELALPGFVVKVAKKVAKVTALAAIGTAIDSVVEGGRLQVNEQSIANITGANAKQMASVDRQMFKVGNMAAMSPVQTSTMFREVARMTQGSMPLASMQKMLPYLAKAQVVVGTTRGYSPVQTTEAMMQYVHLMRLYNPKKMAAGFDLATRFFELIPNAPSQAIRQLTYFVPQLKSLGVPDVQQDALMLTLARAGYGRGKGGTGLANLVMQALGPLQITSFQQANKVGLLKSMGLLDKQGMSRFFTDRKGGDVIGMLGELEKYEKRHGQVQSAKTFEGVFGITGARIAMLLANPIISKQVDNSMTTLGTQKSIGLNAQFVSFMKTFNKQGERVGNNFQGLMAEVGKWSLPALTKGATDFGNALHSMEQWLHNSPAVKREFQRDVKDAVLGTEQFLKAHARDFKYLGEDALTTAKSIAGLTIAVAKLGGAALSAFGTIQGAITWLAQHDPFWKPPDNYNNPSMTPADRLLHSHLRRKQFFVGAPPPVKKPDLLDVGHDVRSVGAAISHALGLTLPAPAPWGGSYYENGRKRSPAQQRALDMRPHVTINHIDARGSTDPAATAAAVKKGVEAAFAGMKNPRSTMASSPSTTRTHPNIPMPLSVGVGGLR